MFYALREDNKDIEKEAMKKISATVRTFDLTDVTMVDIIKPGDELFKDIQKIALNIYLKNDKYSLKKRIKDIKDLQKKHGLERLVLTLLEMYDELIGQFYQENNLSESNTSNLMDDKFIKEYKTNNRRFGHLFAHTVCLFSIVLNNNLFNQELDYIQEKNGDISFIKIFRRESMSIITGYNDLPFIVSKSVEDIIFGCYEEHGEDSASKTSSLINVVFMSQFIAKYFYKSNYPKLVDPNLNVEKLFFFFRYFNNEIAKMSGVQILEPEVFKQRKVLLPANGVILKSLDESELESILLNEFSTNYGLYIVGIARYKTGFEIPFSIPVHIKGKYIVYVPNPEHVFNLIYDFYGIVSCDNKKYEVISPYYWKYRNENYETKEEKEFRLNGVKVKKEYEIKINSFVRKIKGHPSNEALSLAKKLFIELEPNTTIVKEHTRVYNKNV